MIVNSQTKVVIGFFADGKVKCWGMNTLGQLGLADSDNRGDYSGEMGDNLDYIDAGSAMKSSALGMGHTCFLFDDDSIKCCGYNDKGQLGYGDTDTRCEEDGETPATLPTVDLGL